MHRCVCVQQPAQALRCQQLVAQPTAAPLPSRPAPVGMDSWLAATLGDEDGVEVVESIASRWAAAAVATSSEQVVEEGEAEQHLPLPQVLGEAAGPSRRGRRPSLLIQALAEQRPTRQPRPTVDRGAILARARAAKAAKRGDSEIGTAQASGSVLAVWAPPMTDLEFATSLVVPRATLVDVQKGDFGCFGCSPLAQLAISIGRQGCSNEALATIVGEYARHSDLNVATTTSRAMSLGVSRKQLLQRVVQLASAAVLVDAGLHRELEHAVATSEVELLLYVDSFAYDETPMAMGAPEVAFGIRAPMLEAGASVEEDRIVQAGPTRVDATFVSRDSGPA
jgi:hypothetical protein